jgi:trk system potassium uptake protein
LSVKLFGNTAEDVLVVGLGRFGGAVAESFARLGHKVLAIDNDAALVQKWSETLTHVVQADASDAAVLRKLGVASMHHAVVGIGDNIEASVLTTLALSEIGVADIWAKAISPNHGRILERTGAHHVVYPESAMGERVANIISGKVVDFIEFDDGFAIVKTRAPASLAGSSVKDARTDERFGVTVVGVKRPQVGFACAQDQTVLQASDLLIVSGPTDAVQRFAALD